MTDKIKLPANLSVGDLNKAIDALNKRAKSLMDDYQEVGVQALMHLDAHGDVGPINRLIVGMPQGVKRNSMGSWAMAHGALEVNRDAGTKKSMPLRYTKSKATDVEAAFEDKWYDHLPEKALDDVFDLQKAIHGLLQRAKGKTIMLHGKQMGVDHAVDTLKALAAMAGEEYVPDVKQGPAAEQEPTPGPPAEDIPGLGAPAASTGKVKNKGRQSAKA